MLIKRPWFCLFQDGARALLFLSAAGDEEGGKGAFSAFAIV
jgi:hypothetical protein